MTRDEAGKIVKEYEPPKNEWLNKLCPLTKDTCESNCVCFVPSRMTAARKGYKLSEEGKNTRF